MMITIDAFIAGQPIIYIDSDGSLRTARFARGRHLRVQCIAGTADAIIGERHAREFFGDLAARARSGPIPLCPKDA